MNQKFLTSSINFQQASVLFYFDNFASKSVFVIKLACVNLALKTSAAKVLNSEVSIYLSWLWLLSLFSIPVTLVLQSVF